MKRIFQRNTLRNQIFINYMLIMIVILSAVGIFLYDQVTKLLQENTERHMDNTVAQATTNAKLLMNQIDTFTAQVITDATVQTMMQQELNGEKLDFSQRQRLQQEARKHEAFITGIRSLEIYTNNYRGLLPFTDQPLDSRVTKYAIRQVDAAKGSLVWLGVDSKNKDTIIAMRQIRIMNQSFKTSGYLLIQLDLSYFDLMENESISSSASQEYMWLMNEKDEVLYTNSPTIMTPPLNIEALSTTEIDNKKYYGVQKKINPFGWEISILTPVEKATEGMSILQFAIIVSVVIGSVLFLIVTYFVSGMITKPILRLIRAMRSARLGTLKVIPNEHSTMEINELNNTYNQMVDSLNMLIGVVYEKEIIQSKTELRALQAQINPHFLFNTLEAFYWELEARGEEQLAEAIIAMSGIFRYVITRDNEEQWVTLGDELDHAERYLTLMKMRLMERIEWKIICRDEWREVVMPKLLIQPILENAILHGIEQSLQQGIVEIVVQEQENNLQITVRDNGPGMSHDKLQSVWHKIKIKPQQSTMQEQVGFGMRNVEERLKLYYGKQHDGLQLTSILQEGTSISFLIAKRWEIIHG